MLFTDSQSKIIMSILPKITKVTVRGVFFIDSNGTTSTLSLSKFLKQFDISTLTPYPELISMALNSRSSFDIKLNALVATIGIQKSEESVEISSDSVKSVRQILSQLIPCVNTLDPEQIILLDKEYKKSFYSADLLRTALQMDDESIYDKALYASFEYNPRREDRLYEQKVNHEIATCINTYNPPEWMSVEIDNPEVPPLIDKFMRHLFPIEEELEYVYDWLHKSLNDRAYVYLLLNGPKKTGKNTFKYLFKALHGLTNSVDGKKSTLTTQFNGQLSECRAIIFDEIKYSEEEENIMKEIQNDNVAIEKKGVDATRGSLIHCSMLLLNNEAKDNFISVDSRRMSPMSITTKPLLSAMTEEEIGEMVDKVREDSPDYDLEFIANFGHWILKNGRNFKWKKEEEYLGPKFYELVQTSLSEWRRFTLKMVDEMRKSDSDYRYKLSEIEEKFYKKLGSKSAKKFPDYGRVVNFLTYYKNINGESVADSERIIGDYDWYVFPLKKEIKAPANNLSALYTSPDEEEVYDDGL